LNGELEEEIYMRIPLGFETVDTRCKVYKLKKSLYGLKQSLRAWFKRFSNTLNKFRYKQEQTDHSLIIKLEVDRRRAILILYVDDIIITTIKKLRI